MNISDQYLFLKLNLQGNLGYSESGINVSWKAGNELVNFKVGDTYLPGTLVINPDLETVNIQLQTGNFKVPANSAFLIPENEKFTFHIKQKTELLFFFPGNNSISKYNDDIKRTNSEYFEGSADDCMFSLPVNRYIRNDLKLISCSREFLSNFENYRNNRLFEDQFEELVLNRLSETRNSHFRKMNNLNFKKISTKKEIYKKILESVDYMHDCSNENISLDELSKTANISKYHFVRLFKLLFKTTPNNYLTEIRIKKAKQVLESTDISVTAVSEKLGFENLSYFSNRFKKYTGYSPLDFRKISNIL